MYHTTYLPPTAERLEAAYQHLKRELEPAGLEVRKTDKDILILHERGNAKQQRMAYKTALTLRDELRVPFRVESK